MTEKIFISYAHQDRGFLEEVTQVLREYGIIQSDDFSIIDPQESVVLGEDIRESIKKKIQSASKVVIFATESSAASQLVNYEAGMADALDKPIIVVDINEFGKTNLFSKLSNFRSIELRKKANK